MRRKLRTIAAFLLVIGIPLLFWLLPYKVTNITQQMVNIGFVVAGVLIVSPILMEILASPGIWNKVKRFRLQSPVVLLPKKPQDISTPKIEISKRKGEDLQKYNQRLTLFGPHIVHAENALSAGNVNLWLDCYIEHVYWCGLKEPYYPYVVVQLAVISRFIFDLLFDDIKQIDFKLIVEGKKVADKAMLVSSQQQWNDPEEAIEFHGTSHIQSLSYNTLYFRFGMSGYARDRMEADYKGKNEIQLGLSADWKLKTTRDIKKVVYSRRITLESRIIWPSE